MNKKILLKAIGITLLTYTIVGFLITLFIYDTNFFRLSIFVMVFGIVTISIVATMYYYFDDKNCREEEEEE